MTVWRARALTAATPDTVTWWPDAAVEVVDGRVQHVGPWTGGTPDEDLRHGILTPGFVDLHTHLAQATVVGAATGGLLDWLTQSIFPAEARFDDPTHARRVAEAFAAWLPAVGTTRALVWGPPQPDAVRTFLTVAEARGLAVIAGPVLLDQHAPEVLCRPALDALAEVARLADEVAGSRCAVAVLPRFAATCSRALLEGAASLAHDERLVVSTHVAETPDEIVLSEERHGADDLTAYARAGLLGPRTVLAHAVHLTPEGWDTIAAHDVAVAHCPDANAFLGSGGMPVHALHDSRLRMGLGTDVAAGRSLRVARAVAAGHDNAVRQKRPRTPAQWLWHATAGGARALGLDDVGCLTPGCRADLVLHAVPPWVETEDDALSALLFHGDLPWVHRTWVEGRCVWRDDEAPPWRIS